MPYVNLKGQTYTYGGSMYGPGVVLVDDEQTAEALRKAVQRVEPDATNPDAPAFAPVTLAEPDLLGKPGQTQIIPDDKQEPEIERVKLGDDNKGDQSSEPESEQENGEQG